MTAQFGGMTPTGRVLKGPAAELLQVRADGGLPHTAIVFRESLRGAECLGPELRAGVPFMEKPGVVGVAALTFADPAEGAFVYASGTVWSIAEVVRAYADLGETCGHRAGLELAYAASQLLIEASEKGEPHGVWSHRSLSPWRLALREDGQVRILGYGLPQVELLEHLVDETIPIKEDSYRYAPPERIERRDEDLSSDLFALTLIAVELMMGRPVYDGLLADVRQQATRAEGTYRLYRWREKIPATIRDALAPALKYDLDARYRDPAEYVYAVHDLLGSPDIEGPSLMEVVKRVKSAARRGQVVVGGETGAMTPDQLAAIAADYDGHDGDYALEAPRMARPAGEPEEEPEEVEQPRWGSVSRPGRRSGTSAPEVAVAPSAPNEPDARPRDVSRGAAALRERLRRSRSGGRGGGAQAAKPTGDRDDDRRAALRRRLSGASADSGEPPASRPEGGPPGGVASAGRGRRRTLPSREPVDGLEVKAALSTSSGSAEGLLERLRSSTGRRRASVTSRASTTSPRTPARSRTVDVLGPATPPAVQSPEPRTATVVPPHADDDAHLAITLQVGGASHRVTVGPDEHLADAAWRLAEAHTQPNLDLIGALRSGWRLTQGARWWSGSERCAVLDPSQPVALAPVENAVVVVEFVVRHPAHRFRAPVGVAVPAGALVAHLISWLALPGDGWRLYVQDVPLIDRQLLADHEPTPGQVISLRR